jgi:8-oxo-dGTP pyrophosphatase MutT (NUDIX family)
MKTFTQFIKQLEAQFSKPLPGLASQMRMSPVTRKMEMGKLNKKKLPKESAVLILFYPHKNHIYTVFIKRPKYPGVHSGQIAFPGGKYEKEDFDLTQTAVREAHEEIGIKPNQVTIIGSLTNLFIPPSNFNVLPIVAYTNTRPNFIPEPQEVDEIIEININQLIDPLNKQYREILHRNQTRVKVPAFYINDLVIWGATAMIINELIEVIAS